MFCRPLYLNLRTDNLKPQSVVSNHIRTYWHTHLATVTHVPRCTPRSKTQMIEGKQFLYFFRYHHHQEDTSFHYDKALKNEIVYTSPIFLNVFLKKLLDFCLCVPQNVH